MAVDKGSKFLSDLVLYRTYSATKEDGTKESYEEVVERLLSHHKEKFPELSWEIEKLRPFLLRKQVVPAMRALQFSGEGIRRNEIRNFNCSFTTIECVRDFAEIFYILMCGTGVGYSVQSRHVSKLPAIVEGFPNEIYQIPDSKEGWATSIELLIENPQLTFDYAAIRPEGSPLSTGGTASGPKALQECHTKIRAVLLNAVNRKLNTLEVHDIVCHIADAVVVGGVRRAACIALFDAWDKEMATCKSGSWWETAPQRARANISGIIHRQDINAAQLYENLMQACFASGAGEPGVVHTNNYDYGVNPCVTGDTLILTPTGHVRIDSVVDIPTTVWNGFEWSEVTPRITGKNQKMLKFTFSDGQELTTTYYHKFHILEDYQGNYKIIEAKDLKISDKLIKWELPVIKEGKEYSKMYAQGFKSGDGMDGHNLIFVYAPKYMCINRLNGYSVSEEEQITARKRVLIKDLLPKEFVPVDGNLNSKLEWLAGLLDADGCELKEGGAQISSINKNFLRKVQQLLQTLGVTSKLVMAMAAGQRVLPDGHGSSKAFYCQESYRLCIGAVQMQGLIHLGLHCERLKFNKFPQRDASQFVKIVKIEEAPIADLVYCFNEPKRHTALFNGVLTGQCAEIALRSKQMCNLSEVNLSACSDFAEVVEAVQAATILGTLQATYTNFPFISPKWKENCDAEALLGVSLTGQAEKWHLIENRYHLRYFAEVAKATNVLWAEKLGINPAARIGTTKPSGSASAFLSTSSGIHAAHAPYYIRRVRIDKSNPICKELEKQLPEEFLETDVFSPSNYVVSIPIKMEGAIMRDKETSIQLLERMKHVNQYWIQPSHTSGDNSHNVSLTVSYKKEEEAEIEQWMWDNRSSYNGISLLPFSEHTYQQAPFEEITKERYEELYKKFPSVDLSKVVFKNMADDRQGEAACAAGACEWKG